MNRPEPIELENNLGPDAVTGEINRVPWMAYDVDEMDLYIAEKDKEIAELKAALERDFVAKKSAEKVLRDLLDCGLIKEWFYNGTFHAVLKADDPHLQIAELKQKLEDVQASHYAEMVDAGMRERRLRRALWLARAERALEQAEYWDGHCTGLYYIDATDVPDEEDDPYKRVKGTTIGWYKTWMNVESKCRTKAEEYK